MDSSNINDEFESREYEEEPAAEDPLEVYAAGLREVESLGLVDISNLAFWSVSSSKQNKRVKQLRDESPQLFWESDGAQPHHINIHFTKKVSLSRVSIFSHYALDESYTPSSIAILAGNGEHDLLEVASVEIMEPKGWCHIDFESVRGDKVLKTFFIRILIIANHQNGKDTHVRAVRLYSPMSRTETSEFATPIQLETSSAPVIPDIGFTSLKFLSESTIR
ncbi:hypothetical protein BABINDRAFT_159306 [Babjeviella inositovora NRRL Y-12698]|uniref:DOC domain-containing protein n=1 Tax=Babjeviella inositovora NRRL Y-12698 TaxID=984486 RepID=A0A1E3QZ19_9ASCO|nr:uncharacterized protein BABINDRAFT_159306 [Babjeviella inositovora NRRL Y-12698]ODQ82804.1 hypothetical protein BABINDRAFT_159306 [Babjeviella inositovora NRRL Y-12698]